MNFFLLLFFCFSLADVHEELAHWCASAEDRIAARLGYTRDLMANMQAQGSGGKFTEPFAALLSRNTRDQKLLVDTMNLCSWDQATQRKNRLAEATSTASALRVAPVGTPVASVPVAPVVPAPPVPPGVQPVPVAPVPPVPPGVPPVPVAPPVPPGVPTVPVVPTLVERTSKPAPAENVSVQVDPPAPPPATSFEAKTHKGLASPSAPPVVTAVQPSTTPAPATSKVAPPTKAQADPDADLLEFMKPDEPEKPQTTGPIAVSSPKPAKHTSVPLAGSVASAPPAESTVSPPSPVLTASGTTPVSASPLASAPRASSAASPSVSVSAASGASPLSTSPSSTLTLPDPDQALLDVMKNDDNSSALPDKVGDAFMQTSAVTEPVDLTHVTLEDWMARRASGPQSFTPWRKTKEDDSDQGVAAILDQVSSLTGKHISLTGQQTQSFLQLRQESRVATSFRLALERQGIDSRALRRLVANLQRSTDKVDLDLLKSLREKLVHTESKEHKVVRKLTSALDLCTTLDTAYKEDIHGFKSHLASLLDAYRHEPLPLPELQGEINTLTSMDIQETSLSLEGLKKELDVAREVDARSPTLLLQRAVSASLADVGAW